ncbi:CDP-alcohol phosphatidyltransferase family protein [bacterium]|nr:CDP-alcohol phosphatidyltransferase family protein [bacterium]
MNQSEIGAQTVSKKDKALPMEDSGLQSQILLLPNIISVSRLFLIIPIAILYNNPSPAAFWVVLSLILVSYFSDYLDGYLARLLSQQSKLGLILDPVADKIWTAVLVFLLYRFRELPVWIMAVFILRDMGIFYFNIRLLRRLNTVMSSDDFGRAYMVLMGLLIIGYTIGITRLIWLAYFLIALAAFTLISYFRNYHRLMHSDGQLDKVKQ